MSNTDIIFKKPPLTQVQLGVSFLNALEVADERNRYYELVRQDFPYVWLPELNKVTYDFGDYALRSENAGSRLEIGMSYFRLVNTSYPGYKNLSRQFFDAFSKFAKCYGIESYTQVLMQYSNDLSVDSNDSFERLFSLEVKIPDVAEPVFAARGVMVFEVGEGHITVEIEPKFKADTLSSYSLIISFGAQRELTFADSKDDISKSINFGHNYIKNYFFSILDKQYLQHLIKS